MNTYSATWTYTTTTGKAITRGIGFKARNKADAQRIAEERSTLYSPIGATVSDLEVERTHSVA